MAGFQGTRVSPLAEAVREWRLGRFAPLYAAGIVAGVGFGIAVATLPGGGTEVQEHRAVINRGRLEARVRFPVGRESAFSANTAVDWTPQWSFLPGDKFRPRGGPRYRTNYSRASRATPPHRRAGPERAPADTGAAQPVLLRSISGG